ncbi:MAG: DUF4159 domain-containing protein [Planctomycetes bacterium]|nr:DUF4159 domain-containing protein [Planctomycetota bacterium]
MHRLQIILISATFGILGISGRLFAQQRPPAVVEFTSTNIEKAIEKGAAWLLKQQQADGSWPEFIVNPENKSRPVKTMKTGPTALAIYALIASGMSAKEEKIQKALDWLVKNDVVPAEDAPDWTYNKAFCCLAYYAADKQLKLKEKKYQKQLESDVKTLYTCQKNGKYSYYLTNAASASENPYDNLNCQYGVYGVWTGARSGVEVPREYWDACLKHWINEQNRVGYQNVKVDGGWGYWPHMDPDSYPAMTVAGLASLFVCVDFLYADKFDKCQATTELVVIKKGLDWMEKNFKGSLPDRPMENVQYYLYGVERVGLAAGYKYFGATDWYKAGTLWLLKMQQSDGRWRPGMVKRTRDDQKCKLDPDFDSTCYALLFLARGRLPVILNRLEYDGDWNNRPRALANFCRWGEAVYESEVNWQIITLKSVPEEWHDAPVLVISGSKAPKFSEQDISKLRAYVNQGGMLFGITECSGTAAFGKGMRELYQRLFPKYELNVCGPSHILNTIQYKLPPAVRMHELSNGIRPLIIHTDVDLPLAWQRYNVATMKPSFEAAGNVLMYVTDRQLKNRGDRVWPIDPAKPAASTIKAARIRYAGNYDPEPLALQRLSRLMWKNHDMRLDYESVLSSASVPAGSPTGSPAQGPASAPASLSPVTGISPTDLIADIKIAFLTGTGAFSLAQVEKDALKKWVDSGGLLFVDAGGGTKAFADSARDLIVELWGADSLLALPLSSPVYQMKDMTIEKVKYRRAARVRLGGAREPHLQAVLSGDRPKVLFSMEDLTGGLVGYTSYNCDGYECESAFDVMRNVVLYAASAPALPASAPASVPDGR